MDTRLEDTGFGARLVRGTQNRRSTREQVYEVALTLFAERGYHGTSLRDIARGVGIEVGSLYAHIESKEQVLFKIIDFTSVDLLSTVRAVSKNGGTAVERLESATRSNLLFHARYPKQQVVGHRELAALTPEHYLIAKAYRDELEGIFKQLVDECRAEERLTIDFDTTVIAYMLIGLGTALTNWYRADGPLSPSAIADFTLSATFAGLIRGQQPAHSGC